MPLTPAEKTRAYRARQKEKGLPDVTRKNRKAERLAWKKRKPNAYAQRPFVGCDGEGCGFDNLDRQLYMLFRMGDRELFTGSHLSTYDILDFICDHPSNCILVGFAFGYDTTMILRDLSEQQQRRLFEPKTFGEGRSPYVWYKEFDIDYLPKQYLKIRRVRIERGENGAERRVPIKGSARTIYETFGFFQKSFLKVIKEFDVGTPEQRERIAFNKERRSDFTSIDQEERDYCALECEFLAELMEKLRVYCFEAGIHPRSWNGAGKLASALHGAHETPRAKQINAIVPSEVIDFANMAYYGGRFEISRVGMISQKVYEYDIRSAYPAAMVELPCLIHGTWEKADAKAIKRHKGLFVSACSFRPKERPGDIPYGEWGALPIRSREGHLYWPLKGSGVYWSIEIESARRRGFNVQCKGGWIYKRNCDCKSFDWVERLFDYRRSIGGSGPGYPIKLGINSLYGKLAQRKGNGAYNNMVWAGLITAITRAKLNDAIAQDPQSIVMVATDALYSLKPLELPLGDNLGAWEDNVLDGLFIVQPGLYWCPAKRKRKSRGLSGRFFEEAGRTESFESAWSYWQSRDGNNIESDFPCVSVPVPGFIGLKLALSRNRPQSAGCWISDTRSISFDYRNKRSSHIWSVGHIVTAPKSGSKGLQSLPHRDFLKAGGAEPWENARAMLEDQPDYVDLGIPFKD